MISTIAGIGRNRLAAAAAGIAVLLVAGLTVGARLASAETYTVKDGDTLSQVAERLGVPVQRLAEANGIGDPNYLPAGRVLSVPSAAATATSYLVRDGDTLWAISDATGVPVSQLAAANGLDDPDWVPAGKVLTVPRGGGAKAAAAPTPGATTKYTVRPGDALSDIAWRAGVTPAQLAAANGISDPNFLAVGQVLIVPVAWDCPVAGASFVNDYGYVRPDGGRHEGIDMFAPRGTPIVAPVSGTAAPYPNPSGGNGLELYGRDGNRYYFAHLDHYGQTGSVSRGTVVGYVGNTGDAQTTSPHLHFEIHPGGGDSTSPYPALAAAC